MCRFSVCVLLLGALLLCVSCSNTGDEENAFARVGGELLQRENYQWFTTMQRMYPAQRSKYFPGNRAPATALVETQVLFEKAPDKNKLKSGNDWEWKNRFYPAQMYAQQILTRNLGFTEQEIQSYYDQNREEFKDTVEVKVQADTASSDSLAQNQTRDSVFYRPLTQVRHQIITDLFLSKYPPDSSFYAQVSDDGDTAVDSSAVRQRWLRYASKDPSAFFMRQFYEQKFNEPYPDSLNAFYGQDQYITPQDMDVILSWLPEDARDNYNDPSKKKYLVEWLLKWKLFSEQARESGFVNNEDVQGVNEWAWKYEVATHYIEETLLPEAKKQTHLDTSVIKYAIWDEGYVAGKRPDSSRFASVVDEYRERAVGYALEEEIRDVRRDVGVEFLQSDWKDEKDRDPAAMMKEVDSLLALEEQQTGSEASKTLSNAQSLLRDVVNSFPYTQTGKEALIDLAKVQTELANLQAAETSRNRILRDAVRSYRRYQIFTHSREHLCNTFFMIGFIYDEHLERPRLAEVNYKWILENSPDCELADDAEFMIQHLDEPMTSIEELQAQSRRQGRPVDQEELENLSDTITAVDTVSK